MAKGVKIAAGTLLALGAVGGIAYLFRQKKLLKNICVSHTDIGWEATLYDIVSSMQLGTTPSMQMPFQLTLVINSNIDVTVKEVDMSIVWLTTGTDFLASDKLIANIYSERETILKGKSETTLTINVDLSPLAALTNGVSKFSGIESLRDKESDRIKNMEVLLNNIGIKTKSTFNSLKIYGNPNAKTKKLINIYPKNDHRIAMSSAVLGLLIGGKLKINNFETVNTSFPGFVALIKYLGGRIEIKK